tara:strand:- start:205 stop:702 length:498 start_codon:yes stop_codon:yes gene_type:complete
MWIAKKSKVHGTGIFANRDIKKGEKIIRYIGDKISKSEGDRRSALRIKKFLHSEKTGSVYIFELNKKFDIDGNVKRNKARYINHSCDPNCEVEIENNEIWICSIKKIKKGSELSYDYGYEFDKDDYKDHTCKCGSKNCIGYIISSNDWDKFLKHINKIIKNKKSK